MSDIPKTLMQVRSLHEVYLEKYEEACVYRQHADALYYQGHLAALEHIMMDAGKVETNLMNARRTIVEERRNKLLALWRKLKK